MICQLTTTCLKPHTQMVKVNDWRTAFRERDVPACDECVAMEPAKKAENEAWQEKNKPYRLAREKREKADAARPQP